MIARHWVGLAKRERADEYAAHLRNETFPSLRALPGFISAAIFRREVDAGVEFLIVTHWASLDAIRAFAGDRVETAVVPGNVQDMMVEFDRVVRHYHVDAGASRVETSTPPGTPAPIGPYSHISRVGPFITIGGTAGFEPATGELSGADVGAQTLRILKSFEVMLQSAGSSLAHVIHINVFLKDMRDFEEMNRVYVSMMGAHRPARTVIGVSELPKPGVRLTMNLTAVSVV